MNGSICIGSIRWSNEFGMFSEACPIHKLGNLPLFSFQYRQIRDLVASLQRQYDVFHPLSDFEKWLAVINEQNKLSKLYNLLLSFKTVTDVKHSNP